VLDYTGYDVEFRISLAALGNPKPGDIIGFTVVVNDDDDGGPSERQIIWVGTAHVEAIYVAITFTGSLQAADTITGQFTDVPDATSPYPVPTSGPAKFYRK
jgi:hypothetical protein